MRLHRRVAALLGAAALLAACQGNFGTGGGTSMPGMNPPMNQTPGANTGPAAEARRGSPSPAPSGDTASYPFAQAPSGLACPQVQGFTCTVAFNLPSPTPSPSSAKGATAKSRRAKPRPSSSPSPTPSPTPSPSPSPSPEPSGSAEPPAHGSSAPSASPSPAGAQITLQLAALPKDAPKMVNLDPKALAATPLIALRLRTSEDITLNGMAAATFTLPKEQIGGRGFAIQLFQETKAKKHLDERFIGSYAKSTLDKDTLHFVFTPPKLTVKKDETWLLVLYGDERPDITPSAQPSSSASPAPSASPAASASPSPSASPSA